MATCNPTAAAATPAAPLGPSVTDIVEFTRLMAPSASNEEQLQRQVSPDGNRAFILTRKANTRTDRNRYEILLLDLRSERLVQGRYEPPVSVASLEPEVDDYSGFPSVSDLRWADNRTILFRARLRDRFYQVYRVDIQTRALTQLTFSPTGVLAFAASDDLDTLVYAAQVNNVPYKDGKRSVVVGNQSFGSVMHGQTELDAQVRKFRYYVVGPNAQAARPLGDDVLEIISPSPLMSISPDGRWVLLPRDEPGRQAAWIKDYPLVAEGIRSLSFGRAIDPRSYFSRASTYAPMRLVAYRVADGSAQAVIDAPHAGTPRTQPRLLWQDGGESVVIAGTHLPLQETAPGSGVSAHLVEYWPGSGRWNVIAEVKGRVKDARTVSLNSFSIVDDGGSRQFQRNSAGRWQEASASGVALAADVPAWRLRIRQSLNTPPEIFAEGPTGRLVALTQLNTQVSPSWGSMKPYDWKDSQGRVWNGGLLVPAGYQPGTPRPLVIQTYGFHPGNFYLDGANSAEAFTSAFAGRAFLQAGLLVLAVPVRASDNVPADDRERMRAFLEGVQGAIDALVRDGTVDRERIGIIGWSTTGERVLNQVTFTDTPIRAATIADGDSNTLYSLAVLYAYTEYTTDRKGRFNGGLPAGDTLPAWVRNDPSLHTDCIKAAVRIERYGSIVGNNWDIYALMRRQYKAAEMVVIPKGTHGLHRPSERMLSLQGNVDWFRFWLTGGERTEPYLLGESDETLREQYRQWREMAELKKIDDAKPPCARKSEGF